ncbi:hypothetical protein WJX79_007886 [Trebouxia sp. C0005]
MRTLNLQTQLLQQPRCVVRPACGAQRAQCNQPALLRSKSRIGSVNTQVSQAVRRHLQHRTSRLAAASVQAAAATEKPVILVSEKLGSAGLDLLNGFGTADCSYDLTPEQLCEKIQHVDALIVRSATKVTRAVFEASKGRLKVVGRAGVGIDNVDLQAATEYGCLVVNAPTANTVAAAEHGIALICALSRNVAQADASVKRGEWKRSQYTGVSLVGKTLAIMGFGKVGSEVARRARGLGMTIIAHDPFASEAKAAAIGVRLVALNEALVQGDFFSLHMPLTGQTKGMFNDDAFSKIKKGARIINVARGGVIDDHALARALDAGQVAQAALDVFNVEPPPADSPLALLSKSLMPVIGALKGELAATAVNAPMVPAEVLAELQPFVSLSQGLGTAAVQLVRDTGFTDIKITYCSPRGDDLDTRLLRAMVIKGILEQITTSTVNLVNADLLAKTRGLRIIESTVPSEGRDVLTSMTVALGTSNSKFSAALNSKGDISVSGTVKGGAPFLTSIGNFDVDLVIEGTVLLVLQKDRPGLIAAVGQELAEANVNISFMTVSRTQPGKDAVMAIGVDGQPPQSVLDKIPSISGIKEFALFDGPHQ